MAVLVRRLAGAEITIMLPTVEYDLTTGVTRPLSSGREIILRTIEKSTSRISFGTIDGATMREASAAEIAAHKYNRDKTQFRWFVVFLPGGEAATSFAMRPVCSVAGYDKLSFDGSDMKPSFAFSLERVTQTGDEGVWIDGVKQEPEA